MPIINCKVEWANHYLLSAVANDNDDANSDNFIFAIKDPKLYIPVIKQEVRVKTRG